MSAPEVSPPERPAASPAGSVRTEEGELRRRAEEKVAAMEAAEAPTTGDPVRLLHELHVHKAELEMQNEELRRAQAELEASRARYRDLYDQAPVGYCTVNEAGMIVEANLTAARLLGVSRGTLVRQALSHFVCAEDQDHWYRQRRRLLGSGDPRLGELRLRRPGRPWFWAQLDIMAEEGCGTPPVCRVAITDITARKRLEVERETALARLALAEERERQRLSRELHDRTAQDLVALAVGLKSLDRCPATGPLRGQLLMELQGMVGDLQQQVRWLAWDLSARELVEGGLEDALRSYVELWSERTGTPADFISRGLGGERLPELVETAVYRIAREALANVERHARARSVSALLEYDEGLARLTVEDDGCGFDPEAVQESSGASPKLGLLGMKQRVVLVGGTLLIESSPGAGTTVLARIPVVVERQGPGRGATTEAESTRASREKGAG